MITKVGELLLGKVHKLCILSPFINFMKLQYEGAASNNSCKII